MTAPAQQGAFARLIPPMPATAKELGKQALRARQLFAELEATGTLTTSQWNALNDGEVDARDAFFAALERETGIDRELFGALGEL